MTEMGWGSDAIAQLLRDLKLDYAALVPGSSYRGLHDSFVNYLEARDPQMLVCLHEEHTIAIAHGYAKVTGKPMLAVIHANVGLHARFDGVLRRVVRSRSGRGARRKRPARCFAAPALDRLDPYLARSGGARAALYEVGRRTGFRPSVPRLDHARLQDRNDTAVWTDVRRARCCDAGRKTAEAPRDAQARTFHRTCSVAARSGRCETRRRDHAQGQTSGDDGRPDVRAMWARSTIAWRWRKRLVRA